MTAKKRNVAVGALADLFQWYSLPPTHLHHDLQLAAREAGWVPPWDVEDQHEQKKVAGNKSAQSRAGRAALRRSLVRHAHERLKPAYRKQPYSSSSIDA